MNNIFTNAKVGQYVLGIKKFRFKLEHKELETGDEKKGAIEPHEDFREWIVPDEYVKNYGVIVSKDRILYPTGSPSEPTSDCLEIGVFWFDDPSSSDIEYAYLYNEIEYSPEYFEVQLLKDDMNVH